MADYEEEYEEECRFVMGLLLAGIIFLQDAEAALAGRAISLFLALIGALFNNHV